MKLTGLRAKTGRCLILAGMTLAVMNLARADSSLDPYANETRAERNARMDWWRDARFGMFIHWGVYAVPAGTYNGKQISGAWMSWTFRISQPGVFKVKADIASENDSKVTWNVSGQPKKSAVIQATGGYGDYQILELGTVEISEAGTYTLEIKPVKKGWKTVNVRSVTFIPDVSN